MLFLGIIAIHILQVIIISGDQPLPESVYVNNYLIPTKSESESSYLDLSNLQHLTEIIRSIVKNSITQVRNVLRKNKFIHYFNIMDLKQRERK